MGMSMGGGSSGGGRRHARRANVMSEINVTPMVDVMLVLLIIFMVTAPLLPSASARPAADAEALDQDTEADAVGAFRSFLTNPEIKSRTVPR